MFLGNTQQNDGAYYFKGMPLGIGQLVFDLYQNRMTEIFELFRLENIPEPQVSWTPIFETWTSLREELWYEWQRNAKKAQMEKKQTDISQFIDILKANIESIEMVYRMPKVNDYYSINKYALLEQNALMKGASTLIAASREECLGKLFAYICYSSCDIKKKPAHVIYYDKNGQIYNHLILPMVSRELGGHIMVLA